MDDLIPLLNDPEIDGIAYVRVNLGSGIEISAEHETNATLPPDRDESAMLLDAFNAWLAELSPDALLQDWDFPESTLEMLHFLEIAEVESLRESINLIDPLISTSLFARDELRSRKAALLEDTSQAEKAFANPRYERRDWKVAQGSLSGEEADKAGARTTIDLIRKELATYE